MRYIRGTLLHLSLSALLLAPLARAVDLAPVGAPDPCPRPAPGSPIPEPRELKSIGGRLQLDLSIENAKEADGQTRYCYRLGDGSESPTLRLKPGDWLILELKNRLTN